MTRLVDRQEAEEGWNLEFVKAEAGRQLGLAVDARLSTRWQHSRGSGLRDGIEKLHSYQWHGGQVLWAYRTSCQAARSPSATSRHSSFIVLTQGQGDLGSITVHLSFSQGCRSGKQLSYYPTADLKCPKLAKRAGAGRRSHRRTRYSTGKDLLRPAAGHPAAEDERRQHRSRQ